MKYPPQYYQYFELFNGHEFWESHEVLEELWQEDHSDKFLQGLILLSASYVHVQKNNPSGCRKTLERALNYLTPYAPKRWDLDLDWILAIIRKNLGLLEQLQPDQRLDEKIPYIRLKLDA